MHHDRRVAVGTLRRTFDLRLLLRHERRPHPVYPVYPVYPLDPNSLMNVDKVKTHRSPLASQIHSYEQLDHRDRKSRSYIPLRSAIERMHVAACSPRRIQLLF